MSSQAEIKRLRKLAGTQGEVARKLDVSPRTVWSAENDPNYPRRELMRYAYLGLLSERTGDAEES